MAQAHGELQAAKAAARDDHACPLPTFDVCSHRLTLNASIIIVSHHLFMFYVIISTYPCNKFYATVHVENDTNR